jgi:hypothetical protein
MSDSLENLLEQTEYLREVLPDLGKRLGKAAKRLELSGRPVSDNLLKGTKDYHKDFLDLLARSLRCAEASNFSHLPKTGEIASFTDLESFLDTLLEAQRELTVFERVQAIAHRDEIELPSLQECQAKARELILGVLDSEWSTVASAVKSLSDQKSPYSRLLKIVKERETLDDTEWASIQEELSESFGKDLAVAAVRGKLTLRSKEVVEETPLQISEEQTPEKSLSKKKRKKKAKKKQRVSKQKTKDPEPKEQEHHRHHLISGLSLLIGSYPTKEKDTVEASVAKVSLDEICLKLENQPEDGPFEKKERVKLQYCLKDGTYCCNAQVLDSGDQEMRVALTGPESAYRRKLTRAPLEIPFFYSTLTDTAEDSDVSQEVIESQTENISSGGLKFNASSPLTEGENLQLDLRFSPSRRVKTEAIVVRSTALKKGKKDLYSIGVKFLELNPQDKELIGDFIADSNREKTSAEPAKISSVLEVLRQPLGRFQLR